MKPLVPVCALVLLGPAASLCDESFRCGRWIVSSSLTVAELRAKCGEPSSRQVSTQDVRGPSVLGPGRVRVGTTTTEIWRYDRGSRAPAMVVTIVDGKIRSMERAR